MWLQLSDDDDVADDDVADDDDIMEDGGEIPNDEVCSLMSAALDQCLIINLPPPFLH